MSKSSARAGRRLRHSETPRDRRVNLRVSSAEYDALKTAADRAQLSVGAYAARSAVAVAKGDIAPIPVDERELRKQVIDSRADMNRIGNNLNQIAHALNADGVVTPAQLAAVLSRVDEAVRRLDDATISLMDGRRS